MKNRKQGTNAVWGGQSKLFYQGATQVPIVNSVTFGYDNVDDWFDVAIGKKEGYIYSRNTNPTVAVFEEKVRVLENAEAATSFSTGMAAISNTLSTFLSKEDRVVSIKDTYGGTSIIFLEFLPKNGIEVSLCETTNHEEIEAEVQKGCKILYLETPTNPTLKILDLKRLIKSAHEVGALVIVDNTFATPINQHPLELGADLVLHSATKYLGGHSDAMGGVVCGNKDLIQQIFHYREINGASLHANTAYMLLRGIQTLELRVLRQNENAFKLAEHLEKHKKVEQVFYPGLASHPGHKIASGQMTGFGGVLAFSVKGDFDKVKAFLNSLELAHLAASLGSVSTLIGPPKVTSHVETTVEERKQLGIPENLIRCAMGIENIEDIIADFDQALLKI
ncbi:cystathionine gamma-synthase family protein [Balneolaceae bacterium YR4-1]|uniref:Cystathionine gamma-synthase family protein n=1 Tax=Halalkalibaculum roseum TaxID=2709311 RepID=A0A6M1SU30_9BACT|nr:cystathionine gamma-synthase family protein [Halalkalibaculum roseum]NGP75608.1 cystathionine gamma-synthase family protein [Halalkalibaculum roseum]